MPANRRRVDRAQALARARGAFARITRAFLVLTSLGAGAAALAYGARSGWHWLTHSKTFAIRTIEIRGNRRASSAELVRRSGLAPGQNLFTCDVAAAEAGIAGEPWVKSVQVHRHLPDRVVIQVTERQPALLVNLGELYFADRSGDLFKRAAPGDALDLPVVGGLTRAEFESDRGRAEATLRELVKLVQSYRERGLARHRRIEELDLDPDDGLVAQLALPGRPGTLQEVKLGEAPYGNKLDRLAALWGALKRRGMHARVIHLDNRVRPGWVAVKLALATPATPTKP